MASGNMSGNSVLPGQHPRGVRIEGVRSEDGTYAVVSGGECNVVDVGVQSFSWGVGVEGEAGSGVE